MLRLIRTVTVLASRFSFDTVIAGAISDDETYTDAGSAYIYKSTGFVKKSETSIAHICSGDFRYSFSEAYIVQC